MNALYEKEGIRYMDQLDQNEQETQLELEMYFEVLNKQLSRARLQEADLKAIRRLLHSYIAEPQTSEAFEQRLRLEYSIQNTFYRWKEMMDRWSELGSPVEGIEFGSLDGNERVQACRKLSEELSLLYLRVQQLKRQVKDYARTT